MLKKILFSFVILSSIHTAYAADITNPFYLPSKGQVGSITSLDYTQNHYKNDWGVSDKVYDTNLSEELQYGLTDKVAIIASIGNILAKVKDAILNETDRENKNINWETGLAWNVFDKAFKLQTSLLYGQDPFVNRYNEGFGEYKYFKGSVKAGYKFEKMLPYIEFTEQFPIAQKKGSDKPVYTAKVGLYQGQCETWALDTGIRYTNDANTYTKGRAYTAEIEASYYLAKQTALSLYGTYTLSGKAKTQADVYHKSIGARLRWFF